MFWSKGDIAAGLRRALPGLRAYFLVVVEDEVVRFLSPELARHLEYNEYSLRNLRAPLLFPRGGWARLVEASASQDLHSPLVSVSISTSEGDICPIHVLVSAAGEEGAARYYLAGTLADLARGEAEGDTPGAPREELKQSQDTLAQLAHEIRTPISALLGLLQILDTSGMEADQRELVGAISSLTRNVQSLLTDVLDASRIWAGRMVLSYSSFDLRELASALIARYALLHPHLRIELEYDARVPQDLWGDSHRIEQVLANLISNSVKHTMLGGVKLVVQPGDAARDVRIVVRDTGEGIPADVIETVFHAYSRKEGVSPSSSTGLGLYIAKQIVDLHGGTIVCHSQAGKGCEMVCTIPLIPPAEKGASSSPQFGTAGLPYLPDNMPASTRRGAIPRVLLVDDNNINLMVVGKFLKLWNYPYTAVYSGEECLAKLDESTYGLVLLDIRMPGMDGYETAKRIRSRGDAASELPIVALTASTEPGVVERLTSVGMDSYIFKPFQASDLKAVIEFFVGQPPRE